MLELQYIIRQPIVKPIEENTYHFSLVLNLNNIKVFSVFNLLCTETGLTYEALTGKNKQSVPDCERMISPGVIRFMERNNHLEEAKVLKIIHNWYKAVDGRGLHETTRSVYCNNMLQWILDDWMPYLDKEHPNYSLVDVNR